MYIVCNALSSLHSIFTQVCVEIDQSTAVILFQYNVALSLCYLTNKLLLVRSLTLYSLKPRGNYDCNMAL